ncbi:MAG TPA: hypothetical protein PLE76_08430 [Rectinema sp.]|nr:hypothetical protein [Rectinema sp.]HOO02725.1 hypothetical protein [Rectinema sp.]HPK80083.1 hypothetical protein [Rectinema sp.]
MMQTDVEAFWATFEKEIGDKIISKTMGQHFSSKKSQGEWGLLVLTASSIRFRPTPGENWFQSLFRMAAPKVPEEPASDIVLPLTMIKSIELPKKHFFDFLFSPPFTIFTLRYRFGDEEHSVLLGADPKSELFAKLIAIIPVMNEK